MYGQPCPMALARQAPHVHGWSASEGPPRQRTHGGCQFLPQCQKADAALHKFLVLAPMLKSILYSTSAKKSVPIRMPRITTTSCSTSIPSYSIISFHHISSPSFILFISIGSLIIWPWWGHHGHGTSEGIQRWQTEGLHPIALPGGRRDAPARHGADHATGYVSAMKMCWNPFADLFHLERRTIWEILGGTNDWYILYIYNNHILYRCTYIYTSVCM